MLSKSTHTASNGGILRHRSLIVVLLTTLGLLPLLLVSGYYFNPHDATHQIYPFILETKRMLASGTPYWSWDTYLGDNFIGSYAYYTITSPFVWLCCLVPYSLMPLAFTLCLYLKFIVCAWIAALYLKSLGFDRALCLMGSLLYTFSAWSICNLAYYFFLEPMIAYPLVLLMTERFLSGRRHGCSGLIVALAVAALINFYFIPCTFLGAMIYFMFRVSSIRSLRGHVLRTYGIYAVCCVVAVLMASVIILPAYLQLQGSPRIGFSALSSISAMFERALTLLIPKHVIGPYGIIMTHPYWDCTGITLAMFGILPLILMVIKRDLNWAVKMSIALVIVYVTPLNGIFSLFTNTDYCRWGYVLEMSLIVSTLYYLKRFRTIRPKYATVYCICCAVVFALTIGISWAYCTLNGNIGSWETLNYGILVAILLINIAALMTYAYSPGEKPYFRAIILVSICLLAQMMARSVSDAEVCRTQQRSDERRAFLSTPMKPDNKGFIRYDYCLRDTIPSANLAAVYGTPSVEYYHSVRNAKYRDLANAVSSRVDYPLFFYPMRQRESFDALMSVGKIVYPSDYTEPDLSKLPQSCPNGTGKLLTIADFSYYIPFGFAYDRYAVADDILPIYTVADSIDFPAAMLNTLLIRAEDETELSKYMSKATFDASMPLDSLVNNRRRVTCRETIATTTGFSTSIDSDDEQIIFFSVAADPGFTAYIDNEKVKIYEVNLGLSAVVVPAGRHSIEFRYFTPGLTTGLVLSAIALILTMTIFITERKSSLLCLQNGQSR